MSVRTTQNPDSTIGCAESVALEETLVRGAERLAASGEYEQAAEQLAAALRLAPDSARARSAARIVQDGQVAYTVGRAAEKLLAGDRPAARRELIRALELAPEHPPAVRLLEALDGRGAAEAPRHRPGWQPAVGVAILLIVALALGVSALRRPGDREGAEGERPGEVIAGEAPGEGAPDSARQPTPPNASPASPPVVSPPTAPPPSPVATADSRSVGEEEVESAGGGAAGPAATPERLGEARALWVAGEHEAALAAVLAATEAGADRAAVGLLADEIVASARARAHAARQDAVRFGATEQDTRYFRDADELFVLGDFRSEESFTVAVRSYWVATDLFERSRRQALLDGVHALLIAYEEAHESVDLERLRQVWPKLDGRQLEQIDETFRQARSIAMRVDDCEVKLNGTEATAVCRIERTEKRRWGRTRSHAEIAALGLAWSGERWFIETVRSS